MKKRDIDNIRKATILLKELDSKESMLDEIHDRWNDISMELNEGVTKESLAKLINTLTNINLMTDAEMVDE